MDAEIKTGEVFDRLVTLLTDAQSELPHHRACPRGQVGSHQRHSRQPARPGRQGDGAGRARRWRWQASCAGHPAGQPQARLRGGRRALRGTQVRLRLAGHGTGADRLRHGRRPPLPWILRSRSSSRKTCWPTRRCSAPTPAGSTARWSSTAGLAPAIARPRIAGSPFVPEVLALRRRRQADFEPLLAIRTDPRCASISNGSGAIRPSDRAACFEAI